MKILQFAFDSRESSDYMPHTFERHCVVYTGTHDNPTSLGWLKTARFEDVTLAMEYFGIRDIREGNWAFIRSAPPWAAWPSSSLSPCRITWAWTPMPGGELAKKIARLTHIYGR